MGWTRGSPDSPQSRIMVLDAITQPSHNPAMQSHAELLYREKRAYAGGFIEMVVWRVPAPVPPSAHPYKYRLVYVREGKRLVGYDNERGKGGHRHIGKVETPYLFIDEARLLEDFWHDVKEATK